MVVWSMACMLIGLRVILLFLKVLVEELPSAGEEKKYVSKNIENIAFVWPNFQFNLRWIR